MVGARDAMVGASESEAGNGLAEEGTKTVCSVYPRKDQRGFREGDLTYSSFSGQRFDRVIDNRISHCIFSHLSFIGLIILQ